MGKMRMLNRYGQNTAEYAIVIALVIGAVIAMQTYVKRGVQGRFKDASDSFYDKIVTAPKKDWDDVTGVPISASIRSDKQYEPDKLSSKSTQGTIQDYEQSNMSTGGKLTRDSILRTNQSAGDFQTHDY